MKTALIFGVTGQDGSILASLLLNKGYTVHGTYRRSSVNNLIRLERLVIKDQVTLWPCDLTDDLRVRKIISETEPDLLFNEADQDHVGFSLTNPQVSFDTTLKPLVSIFETVRYNSSTKTKIFQPLSSTIFGDIPVHYPQDENTPLRPSSPYAIAKASAYHLCRYYREEHQLKIYTGILYNHDSELRGPDYLLQAIIRPLIQSYREHPSIRAKLNTRVDIGYAWDYMKAALQLLETEEATPKDYIFSTGTSCSISELLNLAYRLRHRNFEAEYPFTDESYGLTPVTYSCGDNSGLLRVLGLEKLGLNSLETLTWIMRSYELSGGPCI